MDGFVPDRQQQREPDLASKKRFGVCTVVIFHLLVVGMFFVATFFWGKF